MKLYELIKDVAETSLPDMEISGVTSDTRRAACSFVSKAIPSTVTTLHRKCWIKAALRWYASVTWV